MRPSWSRWRRGSMPWPVSSWWSTREVRCPLAPRRTWSWPFATGSASTTTSGRSSTGPRPTRRLRSCSPGCPGATRSGSPPWPRLRRTSRSASGRPSGSPPPARRAWRPSWAPAHRSTASTTWRSRHWTAWSGSASTGSCRSPATVPARPAWPRCWPEWRRWTSSGCGWRRTTRPAGHCLRCGASARSPRARSCCGRWAAPTSCRWSWRSSRRSRRRSTASTPPRPRPSCASATARTSAGGDTCAAPPWAGRSPVSRASRASAAACARPSRWRP